MLRILIVFSSAFLAVWSMTGIPENPCSNIFTYRKNGGIVYGEIAIPYDGSKDLVLTVNISMVGVYENVKVNLELLTPADNILTSSVIRYRVNFPFQNVIPRITQITFNNRVYCYGPAEPLGMQGVTNLWASLIYRIKQYTYTVQSGIPPNTLDPSIDVTEVNPVLSIPSVNQPAIQNPFISTNRKPLPQETTEKTNGEFTSRPFTIPTSTTSAPPSNEVSQSKGPTTDTCGVVYHVQPLVLKGEKTKENEYPWLVAMFIRQGVTYRFQCTATLISDQHVVIAAHCVQFYKAPLFPKEDILLILGRSNLTNWATGGATIRSVSQFTAHPEYRQFSGHCDIAVIKLSEPVTFKTSIRPICLWEGETNLNRIVGVQGTVAGWGKDESGKETVPEPRQVSMPVVTQENCLRSHTGFTNLTSDLTFCAGNRDGSGPCTGDSGAGFMVKLQSKWFLRGMVSTAIREEDSLSCNLKEYVVFTDVGKLKAWILSVMK